MVNYCLISLALTEVRARAQQAASNAEKIARKGGLSSDAVQALRREILGIAT
ncbi:hypothetical protein A151_00794 [Escherichia coli KTE195]|nr:hypothetical protein A151_00794 [Escherichia coli KTE195]